MTFNITKHTKYVKESIYKIFNLQMVLMHTKIRNTAKTKQVENIIYSHKLVYKHFSFKFITRPATDAWSRSHKC